MSEDVITTGQTTMFGNAEAMSFVLNFSIKILYPETIFKVKCIADCLFLRSVYEYNVQAEGFCRTDVALKL